MARRGGRKGKRGGGSSGNPSVRWDRPEIKKTNRLFEKYYNDSKIIPDDDLPQLWDALRRDLPNSFRFTGSKGHAIPVRELLRHRYIPEITAINYEGRPVEPPTPLPWYPDQLAWQMTTPKTVIRKFPPFASFQKFLVSETGVGNISRQEVVSMIPPLLLDVKPGMTVLDLCAAPGSKSAQLIEMVHAGEEARTRSAARRILSEGGRELSPDGQEVKLEIERGHLEDDWSDQGRATGLLVANDVDYKRAHMLIHQMKRLNSPNLIVTNHDATHFPSIRLPSEPVTNGVSKGKYLKFDRILADVPCSGDGTPRKNANVWNQWSPVNSLGLHTVQERILVRSLQMLKVGGRVVYSTCSMNPVENEAIVAAAIERCGGAAKVEIVDCSAMLPQLIRTQGLLSWPVMDKSGVLWESWEAFEAHKAKSDDPDRLGRVAETMFPPKSSAKLPLDRCMRVYPHFQDTGGFFITVLEKKSEIKARPENEPNCSGNQNVDVINSTPPITAALNELESKANGEKPGEHIEALDAIAPPERDPREAVNTSSASRQNMENVTVAPESPKKRQLDEIADGMADASAQLKRPKFREEIDAPAPVGEEDQFVHYPPPPHTHGPPATSSISNEGIKKKSKTQYEEPFKFLDIGHETLKNIYTFYKLNPSFPRDRFLVRNAAGNPSKTIYYSSALVRDILQENEGKGIKFVHCGVKMFVKQEVPSEDVCRWRIQSEGLPLIEAWVNNERVIRLSSKKTFRKLLVEMFPKVGGEGWKNLGEIGERAHNIGMGCCILRVEKGDGNDCFQERMVLPIWRSMHSLNLMLPKEDRKAMLLRLYNEDVPVLNNSKGAVQGQSRENDGKSALEPLKIEEKENIAVEEAAEEELSMDEEDGGVKLNSSDVEKEAETEIDKGVGLKDEEDLKQGMEAGI